MSKSIKRKAPRVVRRTLADGTVKEYRYAPHKPKASTPPEDSIEALIRAYLRSPEWSRLKPHTKEVYSIYHRPLERLGHLTVKGFGRRDVLDIRNAIANGRGNGAATGFIRAASALFAWAVEHEWIEHSPVHRIKKLPGGHLPAWSRAEADLAQDRLPEHLRRVVILARYTGQRRGDLCALTWAAYDGEMIQLVQQKTGEPMAIPCPIALREELDAWKGDQNPTDTILTNTLGRPWRAAHLSHELPSALIRIGMAKGLNVHGLRKLAATELADAGCSTHEIAAITGHRTLAMVALYTRSADQKRLAGAAVVKLSDARAARRKADKRSKVVGI